MFCTSKIIYRGGLLKNNNEVNDLIDNTNDGGNTSNTNNNSTNVNLNNNTNNGASTNVGVNKITPQTFSFKEDEITIAKGSGEINFSYSPDNNMRATSTAYQYRFNNSMKKDMAVNLKSISTTSVTLSYAYSDTALDTISSTSNIFECQRISPNATKYIYIVVTPTSTSIPSTFSSSVVFYQGEAGQVEFVSESEVIETQTIVKGQLVNEPNITPTSSEGYTFGGWYLDEACTIEATFPLRNQGTKIYAKFVNPYILPSDWLAWDSSTSGYYVKRGTSTLLEKVIIPEIYNDGTNGTANVTYIYSASSSSSGVFYNQSKLTSVTLASTITSIGKDAFYECSSLTSIDLSKCTSLTSIGNFAFSECESLTSIDLSKCTNLTSIGEYAFDFCGSLTNIDLSNCTSLTSIGFQAFVDCSSLTNINIPSSVTSIGVGAFERCGSLTSVDLSNCTKLEEISRSTFYSCAKLKNIKLPSSLLKIGAGAFRCCNSLSNLTIPASVNYIGESAFEECNNLTSVIFEDCNGWVVEDVMGQSNPISISASDLENQATAAEYLTSTYGLFYEWNKR